MTYQLGIKEFLQALWKHKTVFCFIVTVVTAGVIAYSYTLPKYYQTNTVILPVRAPAGGGGGGLGGLLAQVPFLDKGGNSYFVLYLESDKFKEMVVRGLGFLDKWSPPGGGKSDEQRMAEAVKRLGGMVKVSTDRVYPEKIMLNVTGGDPVLTDLVAKQYLVELQNFISANALTKAKRTRLFLETQLAQTKESLLEMGKTMAMFYGKNDVSLTRASLKVPVAVRTEQGMRNFENYEEFDKYFSVLQKGSFGLEAGEEQEKKKERVHYVEGVPHQVYLQYVQMEQTILQSSYSELTQSYQLAKLNEAKQEPSFQILSEPVLPFAPAGPQKKMIVMAGFAVALMLACGYVVFRDFNQRGRGLYSVSLKRAEQEIKEIA